MKTRSKDVKDSHSVGAAWIREDGSFSISLRVGVVLSWRDMEDMILSLFPITEKPKASK